MRDDGELTPAERRAFERLPREADPPPDLEERVVGALKSEGILRPGGVGPGQVRPRQGGRRLWQQPWVVAGSLAASVALFASGAVLGQWLGSRATARAFLEVREQDAEQLALRIQAAGSEYVAALAALGRWGGEGGPEGGGVAGGGEVGRGGARQAFLEVPALAQGKEAALGALYAAAYELARLDPGDVDVLRVLEILEERRAVGEGGEGPVRNVVWF